MYEIYCKLRDEKGIKDATVSKETNIAPSTFSDWKSGRSAPKGEKLQKIADYFGVTVEYLTTGVQPEHYYLNEETARMAQEIYDNPDMKALFSAARGTRPEEMKLATDMLMRFKETNIDG